MSLERLLRARIIQRIKPNKELAKRTLNIALRDVNTAKRLLADKDYDWTLSIAYNAMLQAGRALMLLKGYRPSTHYGHVAVVKFVRIAFEKQVTSRMIDIFDRIRKKRHRAVYEAADIVSENEAKNAVRWQRNSSTKLKK